MERLASLITGGGTTMQEIVMAVQSKEIPHMEMACVIASKSDAGGIVKARDLGIPEQDVIVVNPGNFRHAETGKRDRDAFGARLLAVLEERGVTVVTQNGWIPHTPSVVINAFPGRIFNQHPGPPEQFGGEGMMGKAVHAAVLEFQRLAGRTFDTSVVGHYADHILDGGSVVKRRKVEVYAKDTVAALQERALPLEHRVQIAMLQDFVRGELHALEPEMLVHPGEDHLLEQAKQKARELFPKG